MKRDRDTPVMSAARRQPGVLAKIGAPPSPEAHAIRALQVTVGKQQTEIRALLEALELSLDGWEAHANPIEEAQIIALRKRWGLAKPLEKGEADKP